MNADTHTTPAIAQLAGRLMGQPVPSWRALGQVNCLPDLGLAAWGLWFATSGVGEEAGWRGFVDQALRW